MSYYLERIVVYANERSHQDTAVSKYQAYVSKAETLTVQASGALAFASPEILQIDDKRLESFYSESNELMHYKRAIDEIMRQKEHTLSAAEENILAQCGEMAAAPENIFSMFNNADIKFPYITDVEGNKIRITHGNFIDFLSSKDRSLRKQVFRGVYDSYKKWSNTVSMMYISKLKNDTFYARVRKYDSARAMYLSGGDIPESVYDNLIETVHAHLPALHRYMALRKKLLGVEHLHMYDLFAPIVDNVQTTYTYDEAKKLVAKALEPMGDEYVSTLKAGMESGWIDVYENENKRSGAYSWGAYGTHPYVLLNYSETLDDMFTLAHEMGHAMHSFYSNSTQPFTYAEYKLFVAEVASTCNEVLLMEYLLKNTIDKKERAYLLNHYLDSFKGTVYRQTMFAEFEMLTHKEVEKKYYGTDIISDEEIAFEWAKIPHFYYNFYVYQYATGFSAAVALARGILKEGEPAVERYKKFLCGGCSESPLELLKIAGVNLESPKPVQDALDVFGEILDEIEALLA